MPFWVVTRCKIDPPLSQCSCAARLLLDSVIAMSVLSFEDLPEEICLHILFFLPVCDLGRTACVSREWQRLSNDDSLWCRVATTQGIRADSKFEFLRLWCSMNILVNTPVNSLTATQANDVSQVIIEQDFVYSTNWYSLNFRFFFVVDNFTGLEN